jgi:IS30 family transposase
MTRRGRKRRLVLEDEYWNLILDGVPTVEACRQIGIGRKTGYRWRAEAGGLPPARAAEEARSSRYLSLLERQRIATLRERGHGVREIARRIGRAPSTVSRELRRHLKPHDKGVYDADLAHARARDNARRQRVGTLVLDPELRELVKDKLEDTWSPQQISAWLRSEYPDRPEWLICHETIYQALYLGRKGGLSRALTAKLRTGRPLRKRRRKATERTPRYVAPAVLIHRRPPIVEARTRIGDWEGDLIVGKHSRSAIGTLVDRTSRAVCPIHLPCGHSAERWSPGDRGESAPKSLHSSGHWAITSSSTIERKLSEPTLLPRPFAVPAAQRPQCRLISSTPMPSSRCSPTSLTALADWTHWCSTHLVAWSEAPIPTMPSSSTTTPNCNSPAWRYR